MEWIDSGTSDVVAHLRGRRNLIQNLIQSSESPERRRKPRREASGSGGATLE